eukprot:6196108-Pleurochrysis_carterae.AAC.1
MHGRSSEQLVPRQMRGDLGGMHASFVETHPTQPSRESDAGAVSLTMRRRQYEPEIASNELPRDEHPCTNVDGESSWIVDVGLRNHLAPACMPCTRRRSLVSRRSSSTLSERQTRSTSESLAASSFHIRRHKHADAPPPERVLISAHSVLHREATLDDETRDVLQAAAPFNPALSRAFSTYSNLSVATQQKQRRGPTVVNLEKLRQFHLDA